MSSAGILATELGESAVATYDCPVCRKAQILDLDRLQVKLARGLIMTAL